MDTLLTVGAVAPREPYHPEALIGRMIEEGLGSLAETGGATICPRTGRRVATDAWAASLQGREERHQMLTCGALARYIRAHCDLLFGDPGLYLGLWRDDDAGDVCLDVTRLFPDAASALAFAAANGQKAVANIRTVEIRWVGDEVRDAA